MRLQFNTAAGDISREEERVLRLTLEVPPIPPPPSLALQTKLRRDVPP
jgi:hypothetical protein